VIEQQVKAEVVAAGGYGGDSRCGVSYIHRQIEAKEVTKRQQLSRVECNESKHKRVIFQRGLVKEETRPLYEGEKI
jgi:hypothetical protein